MAAGDVEDVVFIRPTGRDRFGDPLPGTPTERVIEGWQFAPGPSQETGVGANSVDTDATIYGLGIRDVDIKATDLVRARGDLFTIVGDPQFWYFGTVVVLRKFTG